MKGRGRQATQLRFAKMHGLGNDFMVVDLVTQAAELDPAHVRAWSDRRTGIGFDQLLAVLPPDDPNKDFRCRIFNADGGEAEQCGNGARCVARYVLDIGLTGKRRLEWQFGSGSVRTRLVDAHNVQVDMGVPTTQPQAVPFATDAEVRDPPRYAVEVLGKSVEVTPIGLGNPHAVIFVEDVAAAEVDSIGSAMQRHSCFPGQVNVGFLQVLGRDSGRLRVYERGVGETQACGSGACAAMIAGRLHGRFDDEATVSLPGGDLRVAWRGPGETARLSGAAQRVYQGWVKYDAGKQRASNKDG